MGEKQNRPFQLSFNWLLLAESHLTRRLFGSMLRRMEGLPLPAGQARQQGETNLDDGGELMGECPKECFEMGQILVSCPGKGPAGHALVFGMETDARKQTRRGQLRVYWPVAEMQNGNSG